MWILVEGIVRKHRQAVSATFASPVASSSASILSASSSDGGKESAGGYDFQLDDLRIALFFLFFVQVGFFGLGVHRSLMPASG